MFNQKSYKKAFTLIELMAVVIILGIITTITVVSINFSIKNAKEKLYQEQISRLEAGFKEWSINNTSMLPTDQSGIAFFSVQRLVSEGIIDSSVIVDPRDNTELNGCLTVKYDPVYNQYIYEYLDSDCTVVSDAYKPIINVVGGLTQTTEVNIEYRFPSVTALDYTGYELPVDGPIVRKNSQIVSSVNTCAVGDAFDLTYSATDTKLDLTTDKTVNLSVVDTQGPEVCIVMDGEQICQSFAFNFEADSTFPELPVIVNDNSCNPSCDGYPTLNGCDLMQDPTVSGTVTPNVPGKYYLTYTATDVAGNTSKPLIVTVNVVDMRAPTIPTYAIKNDNENGTTYNGGWTAGNIWLGNLLATDAGVGVEKYQYSNNCAVAYDDIVWNDFAAVPMTFTTEMNTSSFCLSAIDYAGNRSQITTPISLRIDRTAPTITFGTNGNSNWSQTHSTTVTAVDDFSGVDTSTLKYVWSTSLTAPSDAEFSGTYSGVFTNGASVSSPTTTPPTGNYYLWIWAKDILGNSDKARSNVFKLDNTAPTNVTIAYTNNYNKTGSQTITFSATDAESGIASYTLYYKQGLLTGGVCVAYGSWTSLGVQTSPYTHTMTTAKCYQYYVVATNGSGLTASSSQTPTAETKVDTTAPSTPTITYFDGYNSTGSQSITFLSADGESGIVSYTVYEQAAPLTNGTCGTFGGWTSLGVQTSGFTDTMTTGNCYKYYVVATNGSGLTSNSSQTPTAATKVDTTAPTSVNVTYNDGYTNTANQSITFTATDTESGIASYTLYRRSATLSNGTCGGYIGWSSLGTQTSPYTDTVTSGNCYQYYVSATNGVNLTASSTQSPTAIMKVDTTAPLNITIAYTDGYNTTGSQTVTFSATDAESGIVSYTLYRRSATLSNGTCSGSYTGWSNLGTKTSPYTDTMTTANCYQYYVEALNGIGATVSTTTAPTAATKVDTTAPSTPTITYTDGYNATGSQTITFSASDSESGITSYTLYRRSATLTNGTCGGYTGWSSLGTKTSGFSDTMTTANCYQYYVEATNGAGLKTTSSQTPIEVTKVDTTAPSAPTNITYTDGYNNTGSQTITWTASADAESGIASYTVYRRSATLTNGTCGGYTGWSNLGTKTSGFSDTMTTANCYQYYVEATNGSGLKANSTQSPTAATKVDTTASSAPVITYLDAYTNLLTQSISWTASTDAESGIASYTLYYKQGTLSGGTCSAYGSWTSLGVQTSPYTHTMTTAKCYQYYVEATNGSGLKASSNQTPTATTKVDTTAPSAPTITYVNGFTGTLTQSISWTASTDAESGIASYTLYYKQGTLSGGSCSAYGSWTSLGVQTSPYTHTMTTAKCYQYYVVATNGSSLTASSNQTPTAETKVDTTAPATPTITYFDGYNSTGSQAITFSATDAESGIVSYTVYEQAATLTNGTCGTFGGWTSLGVQTSGFTDTMTSGNCYKYYVEATNGSGLKTNSTQSPTAATKVDTTAPTSVTISYTDGYNTSGSQSITFSAADAESGVASYKLYEMIGTLSGGTCSAYGAATEVAAGNQTSPYADTMTTAKCYKYYVVATNGAGLTANSGTNPTPATKVDTNAPTSVTISYTDGYNTSGSQSITFSATDAESGIASYTVYEQTATLTNGTCGTFGGWTSLGVQTSGFTRTMTTGNCYKYYVVATSGAGLTANSGTTPTTATKVDTTAPTGVTISYTDGYNSTGSQSITFSATDAESGVASYTVYEQTATLTNGTCGAFGGWTSLGVQTSGFTRTMTTANCYKYYVVATNGTGLTANSGTTPTAITKVDTTAPTSVTVTYTDGYNTTGSQAITFSAADAESGVTSYKLYEMVGTLSGGTCSAYGAATEVAAGNQTSPYTDTMTTAKCYKYYVVATNGAGLTANSGTSPAAATKVDTTAPTSVTVTYTDGYNGTGSQAITFSATDAESGIASYTVYRRSATLSNGTCSGSYTGWSNLGTKTSPYTDTMTTANCYQYYVVATNGSGLPATSSQTPAAATKVDTTAPSAPTITYTNGFIGTLTQSISWTVSTDAESGIASYTLYYKQGTFSAGTCSAYGSWTSLGTQTSPYTHTMVNGKCYQYYVEATNGSGLTASSSQSPTAETKVDTSAPTSVTITYTDGYNGTGSQSITFSATDAESGITNYKVFEQTATLTNGTCGTFGTWTSIYNGSTASYTDTMTTGNCYRYYVEATNGAGLTANSGTTPTAATKVDTTAPTSVTISYTDGYNTSGSQSITFSATDAESGVASYKLYEMIGTLSGGSCSGYAAATEVAVGNQTSPYADTMTTAKCYKYYVVATNGAGLTANSGTTPTAATKVDTTAPTGVTISYTDGYNTSGSQSITFSATDAESGVASYTVYEQTATLSGGACGTFGGWTNLGVQTSGFTRTMTTANCYKYYVVATSGAGLTANSGTTPTAATKVDTTAPAGVTISYTDGYNSTGSQTITFSATDAESGVTSYTVYEQTATLTNGTCGAFGGWTSIYSGSTASYTDTMTSGNCYKYYVEATNGAGLTSNSGTTPTAATKVDTTAPTSVTISYTDGYNSSGSQSITFSASDPQSGITGYTVYRRSATLTNGTCGGYTGWSSLGTKTSGYSDIMTTPNCYQYYVEATNGSGLTANSGTTPTAATKFDPTAPTNLSISVPGYSSTGSQNITFSALDAQSGISSYTLYYRQGTLSAGTCSAYGSWISLGTQTSPYNHIMTTAKCYQYYVEATNGAGLTASSTQTPSAATKVDTTAPTGVTISYTDGYNSTGSQTITFSATDAESGIQYYTIFEQIAPLSGGTCGTYGSWNSLSTQTSPYTRTMTTGNCYKYMVSASNGTYLTASTTILPTATTKVDTTAPSAPTITYFDGYNSTGSQAITFSATDAESGIASYTVYEQAATLTNGTCGAFGGWTSLGVQTSGFTDTMTTGNCYKYYVVATNGSGLTSNSGTTPTAATKVDTTAPTSVTISYTDGYNTSGSQSITFSATDAESGVTSYKLYEMIGTLSGGTCSGYAAATEVAVGNQTSPYTDTMTTAKCYKYYVVATNGAGLTGSSTTSPAPATKVDTTPPTSVTVSYTNGYNASGSQTITMSGTDAESGMNPNGYFLYRRSASLTNGTCNSFTGGWTSLSVAALTSPYTDSTMVSGNCYQYYATGVNNAGSAPVSSTTSPTDVTKVDTSAPTSVTVTYTNGYNASGSQTITMSGTDAESGMKSNGYFLYRRSAALNNGTCDAFTGGWSSLSITALTSPYTDSTMVSGNCYQYYATGVNNAGSAPVSSTTSPTDTTKVDTTAPSLTTHSPTSAGWTNANITVTFSATDNESNIASYKYCTTTNGTNCTPTTVGSSVTLSTAGQYTLCSLAVNGAGSSSATATCSAANAYKIDTTAPSVTTHSPASAGWTKNNVTVTFSATDAESNIASYKYCTTTNGTNCTPTTVGSSVTLSTTGQYTLCSVAVNGAGTSSTTNTCSAANAYKLDTTAPTFPQSLDGTMMYRDPNFSTSINSMSVYNNSGGGTVTVTRMAMTTPTGSGYGVRIETTGTASPGLGGFVQSTTSVANGVYAHIIKAKIPVGYSIYNASNSIGTGGTHTWITSQAGTGNWEDYIYITRAGSSGTFSTFGHVYISGGSYPVAWDVAYATIIDISYWGTEGSIVFQATDANSGIVGYGINTSPTVEPTYTTVTSTNSIGIEQKPITSNGTYYIWVKDAAGNVANTSVVMDKIDTTAPTSATITYTDGYNGTGSQTITLSATEPESGIVNYQVFEQTAPLTSNGFFDVDDGTCGTYGGWTSIYSGSTASYADTMTSGYCYKYYVVATNGAGLTTSSNQSPTAVTKVDTSAPTGVTIGYSDAYNTTGSQVITFSATDTQSGITSYRVKRRSAPLVNGICGTYGGWTQTFFGTSPSYTENSTTGFITGNCYQYYVEATNRAGLPTLSDINPTTATEVDTTVPSAPSGLTYSDLYRTTNIQVITWTAGSDAESEIASYKLYESTAPLSNGVCGTFGVWTSIYSGSTASYTDTMNTATCYKYYVEAINGAGLTSTAATSTAITEVDTTAPGATTNSPTSAGWTSSNVTVTFSATDAESGIASYKYCTTSNLSTCTPTTTGSSVTLSSTGLYAVCSVAVNGAGTSSTTTSCNSSYLIDKTAPSAPSGLTYTDGYNTTGSQVISWTAGSDTESGISSHTVYESSAPLSNGTCGTFGGWVSLGAKSSGFTDTMTSGYCYKYYVDATNGAGLTSTAATSAAITKVDITAPWVTNSYINGYTNATSQGVYRDAGDPESGLSACNLYVSSASFSANACGAFGGWTPLGCSANPTTSSMASGNCYQYFFEATNGAGLYNQAVPGYYTKVDTVGPIFYAGDYSTNKWYASFASGNMGGCGDAISRLIANGCRYKWGGTPIVSGQCTGGYAVSSAAGGSGIYTTAPTGKPTSTGKYTIYLCATDQAGNVGSYSMSRWLDVTAPTATYTANYSDPTCNVPVTNVVGSDGTGSGLYSGAWIRWNTNGVAGTWGTTTSKTFMKAQTGTFDVRDAVGNIKNYAVKGAGCTGPV